MPTIPWNTAGGLVLLPFLISVGHLVPAIGAIQIATNSYQFPLPLLGLILFLTTFIDSYDKYKDLPVPSRPARWAVYTWYSILVGTSALCAYKTGFATSFRILRFLPVGFLWAARCIPCYSQVKGMYLGRLKDLLSEAKSLVVAVCMAGVTANASMSYYCDSRLEELKEQCMSNEELRWRALLLVVLYQVFRETACDARDLEEDGEMGMKTLPVRLGRRGTMAWMFGVGVVLDALLTESLGVMRINLNGVEMLVPWPEFGMSVVRVGGTMVAYEAILRYPKGHVWAWGCMYAFGLVPVLFALRALEG